MHRTNDIAPSEIRLVRSRHIAGAAAALSNLAERLTYVGQDTSPIFVRKLLRIRSHTSRMPNGGHRSRRDETLTTQVVSLAALVDPMRSGAKIAA